MKKTKGFLLALVLSGSVFFSGCGDDTDLVPPLPDQLATVEYIFTPNAGNSNVSSKNINLTNGSLTDVQLATAGTTPRMVETHPSQRFIYTSNQGSDNISAYAVSGNGGLTQLAGSPFAAPLGVTTVAVDPSGRFLYATGLTNQIRAYAIGSDGTLSLPVNATLNTAPTLAAAVFTRTANGLFLNVPGSNAGVASIETFTVNETTGVLSANSISNIAGGTSVDGLSLHPSGTVLVASVEDGNAGSSSLLPLTVNAGGSLTQVNASAVALAFDCGNAVVSSTGTAYVGSDSTNNVSAFTVNGTTGALASLAGSPFAVGQLSNFLALSPRGGLLYAVDAANNRMSGLLVGSAGALTVGAGSPNNSQLVFPNLPDFVQFAF